MRVRHGIHLGYCTNIHRGETWAETLEALSTHTSRVRQAVCPRQPYGIGLRLSAQAAQELSEPGNLKQFRNWLDRENSYVFTINGFPYGRFHGAGVKGLTYTPDWTTPERLDYTCRLFDLLAELGPPDCPGSVSTLPGAFRESIRGKQQVDAILANLLRCHAHIEKLRQETGRDLHLGLEPEPLCLFETTPETIGFFERLAEASGDPTALLRTIGITFDACHLAVEFEDARESLARLAKAGLRFSKLHLSSALALTPEPAALGCLAPYRDPVYFHQVVDRSAEGELRRFRDLDDAIEAVQRGVHQPGEEWRVHFHIPLHTAPQPPFRDTRGFLESTLDWLQSDPLQCQCLEMETYTWEVLPAALRSADVTEQLIREYEWTLHALQERNLAPP